MQHGASNSRRAQVGAMQSLVAGPLKRGSFYNGRPREASTGHVEDMVEITAKQLLEAGAHFGARASRWNPKMAPYIHTIRNKVHVIDLRATIRGIVQAFHYLQREAAGSGSFLLVGTKRQAKDAIKKIAERCGVPRVTERWLGGTLTNLRTIREQVARLDELEAMQADGRMRQLSKKRASSLNREYRKISRNLSGIRNMTKLPSALIIVDPRRESIAVKEAAKLGLVTIALIDTDCDPDLIDIPIPCNDDSARTTELILNRLGDAIVEGRGEPGTGVQTAVVADEVTYTSGGASFGGDEDKGAPEKEPAAAEAAPAASPSDEAPEKADVGEDVAAESSSVVEASSAEE